MEDKAERNNMLSSMCTREYIKSTSRRLALRLDLIILISVLFDLLSMSIITKYVFAQKANTIQIVRVQHHLCRVQIVYTI